MLQQLKLSYIDLLKNVRVRFSVQYKNISHLTNKKIKYARTLIFKYVRAKIILIDHYYGNINYKILYITNIFYITYFYI